MVPKRENKAWFSLMSNNCPSQKVHPRGAKLPANIFTSPISPSCWAFIVVLQNTDVKNNNVIIFFIILDFKVRFLVKVLRKALEKYYKVLNIGIMVGCCYFDC